MCVVDTAVSAQHVEYTNVCQAQSGCEQGGFARPPIPNKNTKIPLNTVVPSGFWLENNANFNMVAVCHLELETGITTDMSTILS